MAAQEELPSGSAPGPSHYPRKVRILRRHIVEPAMTFEKTVLSRLACLSF